MLRPPLSRCLVPTIAVALAAFGVWWALAPDPDLPGPSGPSGPSAASAQGAAANSAPAPTASSEPGFVRTMASQPEPAEATAGVATDATAAASLRVRLRGLHAEAPWTGEVRFDWQGNDDSAETGYRVVAATRRPDPQGVVQFHVPTWHATARNQQGRLHAEDPNYRPVELRLEGPLELTRELVLDVQVVAVLEGRVITSRGEPVAGARLSAFLREGEQPAGVRVAEGNTRDDGGYRLRVPPGSPLLVVATPMLAISLSGVRFTGEDGAVADSGVVLDHLLPASTTVLGRLGAPTAVPDLVLADAVDVRGIVRWHDGAVVPGARVWIRGRDGRLLGITEHLSVQSIGPDRLQPVTSATTDGEGRFRLPAVPGGPCELGIDHIDGCAIVGDHPTVEATPGRDVELRIPGPVVLRVFHAGLRVPVATIEAEVEWPQSATGWLRLPILALDENSELRAVSVHPALRVRAVAGAQQSAWTEIATAPGRSVDLLLEDAAAAGELLVEFSGEHPVRNATFRWTRDDGTTGSKLLLRDDASDPFRLRLAPGRYRLRIGPAAGERNGEFLLPSEHDVEVTASPQALTLPAAFGGRFTVFATDSRGLYVGGSCRVLDADGVDRSAQFVVRDGGQGTRVGAPGDLLGGGPNEFGKVLPAGDYLLDFGFPEHGAMQRRITIAPREVTDVRIRLP